MTETYSRNRLIGYARVSIYGQALDAQLEQRAPDVAAGTSTARR